MYSLQNSLFIAFLSCLFTMYVHGDRGILINTSPPPVSIREIGGPSRLGHMNTTAAATAIDHKKTSPILSLSKSPGDSNKPHVVAEGGPVSSTAETHHVGEHVIESSITNAATKETVGKDNVTLKKIKSNPANNLTSVNDVEVPPQHDDQKPSVSKKGVSFPTSEAPLNHPDILTNHTTTGTKLVNKKLNKAAKNVSDIIVPSSASPNATNSIPKKPLVTESDSDYTNVMEDNNSKENILSLEQMNTVLSDSKNNRSDYIVPIVAVILSVPLVAILISLLYKRGTDWWQHRNYKRMDFLIEGMYHN